MNAQTIILVLLAVTVVFGLGVVVVGRRRSPVVTSRPIESPPVGVAVEEAAVAPSVEPGVSAPKNQRLARSLPRLLGASGRRVAPSKTLMKPPHVEHARRRQTSSEASRHEERASWGFPVGQAAPVKHPEAQIGRAHV